MENHLVNFNEYYVENFHSRLHANINVNQNAESIINQAIVIDKFNNIYIYTHYPDKSLWMMFFVNYAKCYIKQHIKF